MASSVERHLALVRAIHASAANIAEAARGSGAMGCHVEWLVPGPSDILPFAGSWRGLDGVAELQRRLDETLRFDRLQAREYIAAEHDVIALFDVEGVARRTGRGFRSPMLSVFGFQDERIVRVRTYYDTAACAAAVLGADLRVARLIAPRQEERLTREVTILLAQLRGFGRGSESFAASALIGMLSRCFQWMSDIVAHHRGTIERASGDAMTVAFESRTAPHDGARRAAACAVDMQLAMRDINGIHRAAEMPEMYLGIGLNTGQVLSSMLTADPRDGMDVLGRDVDLASRIQAIALRGQVLMSRSTWERCGEYAQAGEPIEAFVKGQARLVQLRELLAIPSVGKAVPPQDSRRSPRVELSLPCTYRMVVNGAIVPEQRKGRVLDLGYHGALLELSLPLSAQSRMALHLALPGGDTLDVRGRVIKIAAHGGRYRAGIEFAELAPEQEGQIRLFVQRTIQG